MKSYKPQLPYNVAAYLLKPIYKEAKGVTYKEYPNYSNGELFYCSFKTFGGTEQTKDGGYSVIDTANIETWFRPDIEADSVIVLAAQPTKKYAVIGEPENINMRNQILKFKVKAVKGGA